MSPSGVDLVRAGAAGLRQEEPTRRLFVTRRLLVRKRIRNEDELMEVAAGFGFEEATPETLSFRDQMKLFAETEIVAGSHGSALANAIYMPRGTGMCEVVQAGFKESKVPNFWTLAACGAQRYGVAVAPRQVAPDMFERVLAAVCEGGDRGTKLEDLLGVTTHSAETHS
jgi:capsular polysaccharide biosynthesis protein